MRKRITNLLLVFLVTVSSSFQFLTQTVSADGGKTITSVTKEANVVTIKYSNGETAKITFLEDDIFRFHVDPTGKFNEYATPRNSSHTGKIQIRSDKSEDYSKPTPEINDLDDVIEIVVDNTIVRFDKKTTQMSVEKDGKVVMQETKPIQIVEGEINNRKVYLTTQQLAQASDEHFYGGGTQNGRFAHKGTSINIVNESKWVDGGVASPNPFYWSTKGYGVLRNTFQRGVYNFGKTDGSNVQLGHEENQFDAYYFLGDNPTELLQGYYKVTGNPILLPEYAYYVGHLNAYNRDAYATTKIDGKGSPWTLEDGKTYYEIGGSNYKLPLKDGKVSDDRLTVESLNGTTPLQDNRTPEELYKFSARAVVDGYDNTDMPIGYFLPNDGYGAGYGQEGYFELSNDMNRRNEALDKNIENLKSFVDYAQSKGVQTGLWTQSALTVEDSYNTSHGLHALRDFKKEVETAGVRTLKTDVAWVGHGYSMALDATRQGFEGISKTGTRANIISLDGWAGTQRHAGIWTGDQSGGNWEYIRFHIPTYIGQSLSGNPNVGSDIDGIWYGSDLITTRDIQWKTFTPLMLEMDGWGSIPKKPYIGQEDNVNINRMYLKLKAQLMPYLYTTAHEAVDGLPMVRAMFLEYPNDEKAHGKDVQYQFMYGSDFLVAPIYQNTKANSKGDDIRNNIYLPDTEEVWIDYFSGTKYPGGQVLGNFDAPLWKLPLFVKSGAIIPMYEDNNNPMEISETNTKGLDKAKRIVEFFPSEDKDSTYTSFEDDGMTIDSLDKDGNEKANVTYGGSVYSTFESTVNDGTATLTAKKSTGTYDGYSAEKDTTFVVNMTNEPTNISLFNGESEVENVEKATSQENFEELKNAGIAAYFYNEAPDLNKFAQGEGSFAKTEIISSPKLYVSFPKTNVQSNEQKLVIEGYENLVEFNDPADKEELKTTIETMDKFIEQADKLDYTVESWSGLVDALTKAKKVYENPNALQREADVSVSNLMNAHGGLVMNFLKPEDGISDITFTNDIMTDDNGGRLWQQTNWKNLMFDGDKSGQLLEYKWYYGAEKDNIAAEVKLPTDFNLTLSEPKEIDYVKVYNRAKGNGTITSIKAHGITEDGTEVSLGTFNQNLPVYEFKPTDNDSPKFTKIIITPMTSLGTASGSTTGSEANRMLSIYEVEVFSSVRLDRSKYDQLVDEIEALNLDDYTTTSTKLLNLVKEETDKTVDLTNDQNKVDAAVVELQEAKDQLVEKGDFTELDKLIAEVEKIDLTPYTIQSANDLTNVLTQAQSLDRNDTIQADIDLTYNDLVRMREALIEKEKDIDVTKLQEVLDTAKALNSQDYTEESMKVLEEVISEAIVVLKDPQSQVEVDEMIEKIEAAVKGLVEVEKVDTKELVEAIEKAEAIVKDAYTDETVAAFNEELANAKMVLEDVNATQEQIDATVKALNKAINNLEEKPTTPGEPGETVEGFDGLVKEYKVGDVFVLVPVKDDQVKGDGWTYDKELLSATFNSPATFTALKEGVTTIEYRSLDGTSEKMIVKIVGKDTKSSLPGTGLENNAPLVGVSLLTIGIAATYLARRKKQNQ